MATPKSTTAKTPATPKAVVAKPATVKKTTTTTSSKKASTSKAKLNDGATKISPEERYRMVEVAAYFLAERNGFDGSPVEYWSTAEAQINKLLGK